MSLKSSLLLIINWIFVFIFIFLGVVLAATFFKAGVIFIIVAILISPPLNTLLLKTIKVSLPFDLKVMIALSGFLIVSIFLHRESDEQLGFWIASTFLDDRNDEILKKFLKEKQNRENTKIIKETFLATREKQIAQLRSLYQQSDYQEVVNKGIPYTEFDSKIRELVENAKRALEHQHMQVAITQVPRLIESGHFNEAYELASRFNTPELQKLADQARVKLDETVVKLQSLYETGKYENIIAKGTPLIESDCRIKRLVDNAKKAQYKKIELERVKSALKKVYKMMKAGEYQEAYEFAEKFDNAELKELANRARAKLDNTAERQILEKLKETPPTQLEQNMEEYAKLVKLFPDNDNYVRKLTYYSDKLTHDRKKLAKVVSKEKYGEKWPFTVFTGRLECIPPGIVIFQTDKKIYAINELASSQGYEKIDKILKNDSNKTDVDTLTTLGLSLCQ
jgi:hypothetical protein